MGDPIPIERAWMIFDSWKAQARDIGVIFYGQSGTVYTMARVNSARNGSLRFSGEFGSASFNLRDARFLYGPVQIFPRCPCLRLWTWLPSKLAHRMGTGLCSPKV